jgi:hypothetical protein
MNNIDSQTRIEAAAKLSPNTANQFLWRSSVSKKGYCNDFKWKSSVA